MKNKFLILILSLASLANYGQTMGQPNVIITNNVISPTAPYINVQETNGKINKINKTDLQDVIQVASAANLPVTGVEGKFYYVQDSKNYYTFNGTTYSESSSTTIDVNNEFTIKTGFSLATNVVTVNAANIWKLNGVTYTNPSAVNITIPYSTTGKQRIVYVVPNVSNGFSLISGTESTSNPTAPTITNPDMYVTFLLVTDGTVVTQVAPDYSSLYLKRYKTTYNWAGVNYDINPNEDDYLSIMNNSATGYIAIHPNGYAGREPIKDGAIYTFKSIGTGNVNVIVDAGVTLNAPNGTILPKNKICRLIKEGTASWYLEIPTPVVDTSGKANIDSPTFTGSVQVPNGSLSTEAVNKGQLDLKATDANVVHKTSDESISGTKTFTPSASTSSIKVTAATGVQPGISISVPINTGIGLSTYGTGSGTGIQADNTSTGTGILSVNQGTGKGIYSQNLSSGDGITAYNGSTGKNIYASSYSTGPNIVANALSTSTAYNYIGQNNGTNTFTVNKLGEITGTKFIKSGGTSSQYLMADGTTTTSSGNGGITSSGTTNSIQKLNSSGNLINSGIIDDGNSVVIDKAVNINGGLQIGYVPETNEASPTIVTINNTSKLIEKVPANTFAKTSSIGVAALNEGNGIGVVINNRDANNYGNVGLDAVDLSNFDEPSTTKGATGEGSFAQGYDVTASGYGAISMGNEINTSAVLGFSTGINQKNAGYLNNVLGAGHDVTSIGTTVIGQAAEIVNAGVSDWNAVPTKPLFVVGNGTIQNNDEHYSVLTRSNAFRVDFNGLATLPSVTNAIIDADVTGKAIPTKEWVLAIAGVSGGTSINTAFTTKTYAATMSVAHDASNPNWDVHLTGDLDLTLTGTVNGDSGLVNLYFSGTEVATLNGVGSLTVTGSGAMIPVYFVHDSDGIKWYKDEVGGDISGLTTNKLPKANEAGTLSDSSIIDYNGNIGIGVNNPIQKLEVDGYISTPQGIIFLYTGNGGMYNGILFQEPDVSIVSNGQIIATFKPNVFLVNNLKIESTNTYIDDASADADANLESGTLYWINGDRVPRKKP